MKFVPLSALLTIVSLISLLISPTVFSDTYVSNCDSTVLSSYDGETIYVTNDIFHTNEDGDCILIVNEDVTLDCQGYRISSDTGPDGGWFGVFAVGDNPTIQNCEFNNFALGIAIAFSTGGTVIDNKAFDNHSGIAVALATGIDVIGNKLDDNRGAGITVQNFSTDCFIYQNTAHGSGYAGIILADAPGNYIVDNQTNKNGFYGIALGFDGRDADNNHVIGNTSNLNGQDGIAIYEASDGNTVEHNVANRNDRYGIGTDESNSFDNNVCKRNGVADSYNTVSLDSNCK